MMLSGLSQCRHSTSNCTHVYMDTSSLAAKAELHSLPGPLAPYLEPTPDHISPTPHSGKYKSRELVDMSQV